MMDCDIQESLAGLIQILAVILVVLVSAVVDVNDRYHHSCPSSSSSHDRRIRRHL